MSSARLAWEERNRLALAAEIEAVRRWLEGEPAAVPQPAPALDAVCHIFGLSSFERALLVLCAGVEMETELAQACVQAHGRSHVTFGLSLAVLPEPHWSALVPTGPLRRWRLVEVEPGPALTSARLRIDERILHLLAGVPYLDSRLEGLVDEAPPAGPLAPSHTASVERVTAAMARTPGESLGWPRIELLGAEQSAKRLIAAEACARAGHLLYLANASALPTGVSEGAELATLWGREAALSGGALLVDAECLEGPGDPRRLALVRFARRLQGVLLVSAPDGVPELEGSLRIEVPEVAPAERRELWRTALGARAAELNGQLDRVAGQFDVEPTAMRAVSTEALASDRGMLADRVWAGCRVRTRPQLDGLAQRIVSVARWDDLVIPEMARCTLQEIAAQVRRRQTVYEEWGFAARGSRGLGITTLFAGPSGTGKTMAAEVLANALALDLYRIDLSSVVSKYIGETEKNLRRVFGAAERGGAVLLFDEADALFGKRTEVKDSHDRFANIEVSYLLQRMEAYRGLAILTTNRREDLDEAFLRRLRFVVEFPFPDLEQRAEIWRGIFPAAVPLEGLQPEALARLTVTGGNIRNIALGAAFLAAEEESPVRMEHLRRAARSEYAKLERPLSSAELWDPE